MNEIKEKLLEIINNFSQKEQSSTGFTGEEIIYWQSYDSIADDVIDLIQTIFDPENQPNQLGIENPFKPKYDNFNEAVEPAIRYLFKNHNPHTKIHIDYDSAELLEGQQCHNLRNEIPD